MASDTRSRSLVWATRAVAALLLLSLAALGAYYLQRSSIPPHLSVIDRDIEALERDIRQRPDDPELRVAAANLYTEKGRLDDAISQAGQVLKINPRHFGTILALADAHGRRGETDMAVKYLTLAADLNKDNPMAGGSLLLATVHQRLGNIYLDLGRTAEAISELQQTLEINRTDADALRLLGNALEKQGRTAEAILSYRQSIRYVPEFTEAHADLLRAYRTQGDLARMDYAEGMLSYAHSEYDQAIARLERVNQSVLDMPEVHLGLAMAYEKVGRSADALEQYRQALTQDPTSVAARRAVARLGAQP